ncbi:MAG TPA: UDP-3-O-acyl-N-acetylglucosamine deacetylase [Caulobacteraceae bacterium]|nr:UDP-3-O-acyl-N-acetylglucosamine deacetylase [Caulobacteraceae bacterium]
MSPFSQVTLARPVSFEGVGIHTGRVTAVTLRPAGPDSGVRFLRTDVKDRDPAIAARGEAVCQTRLGTVIGNADGVSVATIEHLMAAFCGLGVDNVLVEIDGPEVPIMDGSCRAFVAAIDSAGRKPQAARRRYIEILETVVVREDDKSASLSPAEGFEVAFEIAFDSAAIGHQRVDLALDEIRFREELAPCRTFGFLHEVEALRQAGLARGGTLDNVLVIEGDRVLNPDGLRRFDEFVRHKALDAVGDLYLLGAPLIGRYEGLYAGHGLNNALVRAVLARPEAWRFAAPTPELARAV